MRYRKMETNLKLVKEAQIRQEHLLKKYAKTAIYDKKGGVINEMQDNLEILHFLSNYPSLAQKHLPVLMLTDLYNCFDKIFFTENYVISKAKKENIATVPLLHRRYHCKTEDNASARIFQKGNYTQPEDIINILTCSTDDIMTDANRYNSLQETVVTNFLRNALDAAHIDVKRNPISGRPNVHTCHTVSPIGEADIIADCKLSSIFENIEDVNAAMGNRRFDFLIFLPNNQKLAIEVNCKQLHDKFQISPIRRKIFQEAWNLTDEQLNRELKKAAQLHNAMKNFIATSIGADYMEIPESEIGCCESLLKKKLEEMVKAKNFSMHI